MELHLGVPSPKQLEFFRAKENVVAFGGCACATAASR